MHVSPDASSRPLMLPRQLKLTRRLLLAQLVLRQQVEAHHLFVNVHGELILQRSVRCSIQLINLGISLAGEECFTGTTSTKDKSSAVDFGSRAKMKGGQLHNNCFQSMRACKLQRILQWPRQRTAATHDPTVHASMIDAHVHPLDVQILAH